MNLLITNAHEDQVLLIARYLRAEANRIVVTICANSFLQRWGGLPMWSRHVDKRYRVPDCAIDWRKGIIQERNTPEEERYVRRIEEICTIEGIDVILPSYDAEVYVFAKNKARFAARGIIAAVPEYEPLTTILDKSKTLEAAARSGFAIPRTVVPENVQELLEAAREMGPPWVLKSRCSAHGMSIEFATSEAELERKFIDISALQDRPMLQEFVPPLTKRNYYVVIDREGEAVSMFSPEVHRLRTSGIRTACAAVEPTRNIPFETEIRALLRALGIWGGLTLQTLVDARDGKPKLMEINPRFGGNVWFRTEMGINEPLMLLRIAQGKRPGHSPPLRQNVLLVDPLMDFSHLVSLVKAKAASWLRARLGRRGPASRPFEPESVRGFIRSCASEYLGSKEILTCPFSRKFFLDPLPPLVRFCRVALGVVRLRGH